MLGFNVLLSLCFIIFVLIYSFLHDLVLEVVEINESFHHVILKRFSLECGQFWIVQEILEVAEFRGNQIFVIVVFLILFCGFIFHIVTLQERVESFNEWELEVFR